MTNKPYFFSLIIGMLLGLLLVGIANADDRYVGLQITVPLSFDAVGAQLVGRHGHFELRAGGDTSGNGQAGAGLTAGEDTVGSAGLAFSTHHGTLVGYVGLEHFTGDVTLGVVTYGATAETTYLGVGKRFNYDEGNTNGTTGSTGDGDNEDGSDSTGGDSGGDGDSSGGNGGDDDTGGDDSGDGKSNHSGLGDGTNPGKGGGRDHSPNDGANNPHH